MSVLAASPGDVLAVWQSGGLDMDLVRVGEALEGKPAVAGHVVIVTHLDSQARWIGIAGQPGGVGLVDCTMYLGDSRTRSNHAQPKPGGQQAMDTFLASCAKSLGVKYDWAGIADDTAIALHLNDLTDAINAVYRWPADHHLMPGEMVCSSLASWQYENVSWLHPGLGTERNATPADWWNWSDKQLWQGA